MTTNGHGATATLEALSPVTNDGELAIDTLIPYQVTIRVEGVAPFLYHRWSNEDVAAKGAAAKGSKAKKTDNVEAYVWRLPDGELAIPGEYFRQAVIGAARYLQDPRSPRKSAMDLFKAGVVSIAELAGTGKQAWDYIDQRRVTVQRNGVTRMRPALATGWTAEFVLQVQTPEYIPAQMLNGVVAQAGRLIGIGDFRPSYGRFNVTRFEVA